ncbi:MAG: UDP-N-acetylglucosamine--N-acetylmuramyl-(pentapeptide) pyrophosphoryl-undecaprenol N-acetylglucosamine transferase [Oscillospiraceae bacterium]|nr:UDP-N-acetylglucosamine--N-acetylmuramyl-(pentapeptide) pyrophosphoryl-undecaprenol N-acetylglucosamine transferase [Oscillospiraceae bacterium]
MNIVLTCGGTGGHIYPAIAIAKMLQSRVRDCKILFIGADGMEADIIPREGFRLEQVKISNYQRKLTPSALWHNAVTAVNIAAALRKANRILREFEADAVIGTGGYASFPALREGARLGIPTFVHESNAVPGMATRMVADKVDTIFVPFEACRGAYRNADKVQVVGTPVRDEFVYTNRADARKKLGIGEEPFVVSCWGSLGAREMNKKITQFMLRAAKDGAIRHTHATGSYGWRWMPDYVREHGLDLAGSPNVQMCEFLYDMPTVMAAADLMICRAGAATIAELTVAGAPAIIVPSPNVTDHHQEKNAAILGDCGAAVVLDEKDCDGDALYDTAIHLLQNPSKLASMRTALASLAVVDSTERICQAVLNKVKTR